MDIIIKNEILKFLDKEYKCAIGKNGIIPAEQKQEGDGMTPAGKFQIRKIYFRADKIKNLKSPFEMIPLSQNDGWCDDSNDPKYNQFIKLPYKNGVSFEHLWQPNDDLYDIIIVIGFNDNPPIPNKGSAIFIHIARENYSPTAGCIALKKDDLLEILKNSDTNTKVIIKK